jgi:hypothetical protein
MNKIKTLKRFLFFFIFKLSRIEIIFGIKLEFHTFDFWPVHFSFSLELQLVREVPDRFKTPLWSLFCLSYREFFLSQN